MSSRKTLNMDILSGSYSSIIKSIGAGNVYVCRYPDGVCVLINKQKSGRFKFVMYNPISHMVTRAEISREEFEKMYNDVFVYLNSEHYEIKKDKEIDVIEQFDSIADALMALKKGIFRSYRVRKFSWSRRKKTE